MTVESQVEAVAGGAVAARRAWWLVAAPWGASVLFHVGLVVAGLGITIDWPSDPGPPAGLRVAFDDPGSESRVRQENAEGAEDAATDGAAPAKQPVDLAALAESLPTLEPLGGLETESLVVPVQLDPVELSVRETHAAPPPEFFGAKGEREATRIVYVVDASGSMVSSLASVVKELKRSIRQLGPGQWFQVLIFQEDSVSTPPGLWGVAEGSLIRVTDENRRAVFRWLDGVGAARRSDPIPALEKALSYKPDLVFLLSKGILDGARGSEELSRSREEILSRLEQMNPRRGAEGRRRATIKVIQFFDNDPGGVLHAIAERHGGPEGFTFISRKELGLE